MKFLLTLVLGIACGVLIALALLLYNPVARESLSPLSVSEHAQFNLNYSTVVGDSIALTNNGERPVAPKPAKISQLWESPIRKSNVLVTYLRDGRGNPIGVGIKYSSLSEDTSPLRGEIMVDSVWHVVLPARGTLMIGQTENYWNYLREVVLPAYWSSADSWKGKWHGTLSSGPGALGTAFVFGGSGRFKDVDAEAIETVSASAYSAKQGPVAVEGQLLIELASRSDGSVVADAGDR
jgi:hypothetical protein